MPITPKNMQTLFSNSYLLDKLLTLLHSTLVHKRSDQFNAELYYEMRKIQGVSKNLLESGAHNTPFLDI